MIYREHYIQPVREFYESDLIKIITGIRRSGKSVILQQIMEISSWANISSCSTTLRDRHRNKNVFRLILPY